MRFDWNFDFKRLLPRKGLSALAASVMAIVIGLIFGYFVMLVAYPENAWQGLKCILTCGYSVNENIDIFNKNIANTFFYAIPIMMTGLAVGFAFKMGLFNIGASGQFTAGLYCAIYAGFMWQDMLPPSIHWILCILMGMLGGMIWGLIPGLFKALLNVNEVITSIMFNYIGMYLVNMLVMNNGSMYDAVRTRTRYLPVSAQIPAYGETHTSLNISLFFVVGFAIFLYIILWVSC